MVEFKLNTGNSPLLAAAIHNGHRIRPELLPYLKPTDKEREREEDPHTAELTDISGNSLEIITSRFEVDINRPRELAVYQTPKDAWGIKLHHRQLPAAMIEQSLQYYDQFYARLHTEIDMLLTKHQWLIVYDLHSYNHRRAGIDQYDDPETSPEVNIGTDNVDKRRWGGVIDRLITTMLEFNFEGRHLDVRENIRFKGGFFTKWMSMQFGDRICPIAIEFKKIFMNEWTGEVDRDQLDHLRQLLISTIHPVIDQALKQWNLAFQIK